MTFGRLAVIAVRAGVISLIIVTPFSGGPFISWELWLTATAVLIAVNLVLAIIKVAQLEPARIAVAWAWRTKAVRPDLRPSDLRSVEGLLGSAQSNRRAYANRLRPRLIILAEHFLPINHALDPKTDPSGAKTLFGDVAWMIEQEDSERKPTVVEIDRFLDIVLAEGDYR